MNEKISGQSRTVKNSKCKLTDQRRSSRKWKTRGGKQTKQARRREIRTLLCVTWRRIKEEGGRCMVKRRISDYKSSFSCGKLSDPRHKDRIPRVDAVVVDEELVGSQEAHGCGAKILHGEDINQCE
ncbi:hypothetical protein SAY87_008319 [Trapa incisa]|uniref:Uncharacterized protein n=1 Tax=Trapa incisa TaxID=236973 RepID=A0AAN7KI06_9MYRT|nr:hypothetical protein SAY87_008319 [Trapa incisa]